MKYTQFNGKYYVMKKDNHGAILLTPAVGLDRVKAWARETILNASSNGDFKDVTFIKADTKVICLADTSGKMCGEYWGMASCRHDTYWYDEFDYEIGKAISFCRAFGYDIPQFVSNEDAD